MKKLDKKMNVLRYPLFYLVMFILVSFFMNRHHIVEDLPIYYGLGGFMVIFVGFLFYIIVTDEEKSK